MQVSRFLKVLVVLSALMLLVPVAAAAKPGASHDRPFQVEWSGTFVLDPSLECPAPSVGVRLEIEGHGTHMGRVTAEAHHCTNLETGQFTGGVGFFEAANGDRLNSAYSGQLIPTSPTTYLIQGVQSYRGGTGRFENATGWSVEDGWAIFTSETAGLVGGTLVGALSYDASDRSN
ncbi:MAG: hypothetical protein U9N79_09860 [Actinomycetota bacterium]|nr:hypothetical protein [Actinomycetota bacterium]